MWESEIEKIRQLDEDWHSCGAAPPNEVAIDQAIKVLKLMDEKGHQPTRIAPSTDEAVCIAFENGKRYGDIECYNDGEMIAIISDGNGPEIWEVFDLDEAIERIVNFVK